MNAIYKLTWFAAMLLCTGATVAIAQTGIEKTLARSPQGVGVFLGREVASSTGAFQGYSVFRKAGEGEWQRLTSAPITMREKSDFAAAFGGAALEEYAKQLQFADADALLSYIRRSGKADTLSLLLFDRRAAELLGVAYEDTTAREGLEYEYGIATLKGGVESTVSSLGSIKVEPQPIFALPPTPKVTYEDSAGVVRWQAAGEPLPFGYIIERANAESPHFREVGRMLVVGTEEGVEALFYDTTAVEGSMLSYRLLPFDYWGNTGMSGDEVSVLMLSNELPAFIASASQEEAGIIVRWQPTAPCRQCKDIVIRRAMDSKEADFTHIATLGGSDSLFIDTDVQPGRVHYYTLQYRDYNGNEGGISAALMAKYTLLLPPPAPTFVVAEGTEEGIALRWNASAGLDIIGYHVLRAGAADDTLLQITNDLITDTVFADTSFELSAYQGNYYAVFAVNSAGVVGDTSERAFGRTLKEMEKAAPQPVYASEGIASITLTWQDETVFFPWIAGYNIYRREGEGEALRLNAEPWEHLYFKDTLTLPAGKEITYFHRFVDIRGKEGPPSDPIRFERVGTRLTRPIGLTASATEEQVALHWAAVEDRRIDFISVLRSRGGAEYALLSELVPTETSYTDTDIQAGEVYYYRIAYRNADGSLRSESREVLAMP